MYILDLYCPKLKIAIEVDGGQHAEKESQEYDEIRSKYLKMQDIEVIRFWNNEVIQNMEGVLLKISEKVIPPDFSLKEEEG
jgi:very-short-patch-repair endonuclease